MVSDNFNSILDSKLSLTKQVTRLGSLKMMSEFDIGLDRI